jgi:hypothetical protein
MKFWRTRHERTRSIHGHFRRGMFQLGFHAHLHGSPIGDRLVVQPFFILDQHRGVTRIDTERR